MRSGNQDEPVDIVSPWPPPLEQDRAQAGEQGGTWVCFLGAAIYLS